MTISDKTGKYTLATSWEAHGAIVGIITCRQCGAAILLDPRDKESAVDRHTAWHEELRREEPEA